MSSSSGGPREDLPTNAMSSMAIKDAVAHRWFPEPTHPVSAKYVTVFIAAQLLFFVALLGPAVIGIALKVQDIASEAERTPALGLVSGLGALAALVGNVVFGRLSDRTTSRWGRRRPWIVGGTVVMTIAFVIMALAPSVPVLAAGWSLAQLAANATLAAFLATISDQVPKTQRGSISALIGIAMNVGVLGGVYVAQFFADQMIIMFVGPALLAIAIMLLFAVVLPDQRLPERPARMDFKEWARTFWVNPLKQPDFALAWWSRFLITLATFMFTTYRLYYLQDELGISEADAPAVVSTGVLVYTIALVASGWFAGKLSDRTGRRKFLVAGSTLLFAAGTFALVHVDSVSGFYVVEVVLGFAFGIYMGVDLALVVDVLPNPDDAGKDLGVFNMANALPQSLAPAVGAFLLGVGSDVNQNYSLLLYTAAAAGLVGALVVLFIRKVR